MTPTDLVYTKLINTVIREGELVPARNGNTYRVFNLPTVEFTSTPLVTVRKTAWKKAIKEMEWFLSGSPVCPDELLDWWENQLNPEGAYLRGYGSQLRRYGTGFDQVEYLINNIREKPFHRAHILTTWDAEDMPNIAEINNNPNTPRTCHTTIAQFFVSQDRSLSLHSYQRSADMLLGVPHNWIQSWALLLWLCEQTNTFPGKMLWTFGDAHIYRERSHMEAVEQMIGKLPPKTPPGRWPRLHYAGQPGANFTANDFEIIGEIPEPTVLTKPVLL